MQRRRRNKNTHKKKISCILVERQILKIPQQNFYWKKIVLPTNMERKSNKKYGIMPLPSGRLTSRSLSLSIAIFIRVGGWSARTAEYKRQATKEERIQREAKKKIILIYLTFLARWQKCSLSGVCKLFQPGEQTHAECEIQPPPQIKNT